MTCKEVQQNLLDVMEGESNREFHAHLQSCSSCSGLVSDLELIAREARQLAESEEPAPRVWVRIAAELRNEGLIREPEAASLRPVLVPASPKHRISWWLIPVAAALLAAGGYYLGHQTATQSAQQTSAQPGQPTAVQSGQATTVQPGQTTPAQSAQQTPAHPVQQAQKAAPVFAVPNARDVGTSDAGADDQQFMTEVGQRAPTMQATYENELRSVNAYIRDAEAYVAQNPGDEDARQHLADAYQQKAMLYQMALDHIQ